MLVYESELVAEVAELEIVADSGVESIKASVLWRRVESRTIVHSKMNSSNGNNNEGKGDEKALVTTNQPKTDQSDTKPIPSANKNKKPKTKGKKKHVMIECKTFVFKPSNNGVINFGYKGLFDEKVMKEADRVFQEEKAKEEKTGFSVDNSADSKNVDGEDDERRRKQPTKPEFKGTNKIVVESKELDPFAIKQHREEQKAKLRETKEQQEQEKRETKEQQEQEQEAKQEQQEKQNEQQVKEQKEEKTDEKSDEQIASRPISIPRRRRNSAPPPSLPAIKEETPSELDAAERERWFFEDFCCGVLPPPEELDDWSEPATPAQPEPAPEPIPISPTSGLTAVEEKELREKLAEVQKLGFKRVLDAKGNKIVMLTAEAKAQLLQSEEFKDYAKRMNELKKMMGKEAFERTMKIEMIPSKAALEPKTKHPSPLTSSSVSIDTSPACSKTPTSSATPPNTPKTETSGYLSSAGVLETPMKSKAEEELEREEMRREKDVVVDIVLVSEDDGTKPGTSRKQPKVDLSSFKRRRI